METAHTILEGHTQEEKTAYLTAIASIATADRHASAEELESITAFCQSAAISEVQTQAVLESATGTTSTALMQSLTVLKNSDLKYSLITDLIAFAKSDSDYSESEQQSVQSIASYLEVNNNQFSLLHQFADTTTTNQVTPEQVRQPGFLSSLGIEDKLKAAGINTGSLLQGLLGIAAPMLITRMLTNHLNRNSLSNMGAGGGMFGNGVSGGGLSSVLGGIGSGGFGSIISMLNGGRGFGNAGGLLGTLFGGNR